MRECVESETLLLRIEAVSAILLFVFTFVALVWFSRKIALDILLGGGIVIISFQVLKRQLRRFLQNPDKLPRRVGKFTGYYVRYVATLLSIFLVLYLRLATPIPFLVGLSIMVLSIVMVGVFEFIMMKKGES